jgi:hypothetical protein
VLIDNLHNWGAVVWWNISWKYVLEAVVVVVAAAAAAAISIVEVTKLMEYVDNNEDPRIKIVRTHQLNNVTYQTERSKTDKGHNS